MKTGVNYNIRVLRKYYHVTQEQMAELLDMKRSTYAHTESYGTFKPHQLQKISTFFGITTDDLINGTFELPNNSKKPKPVLNTNSQNSVLPLTHKEINLIEMYRKLNNVRKDEILLDAARGN